MRLKTNKSSQPFGSDSFLDTIANLVGIVIILIVLLGERLGRLPEIHRPGAKHAHWHIQPAPYARKPETTPEAISFLAHCVAGVAHTSHHLAAFVMTLPRLVAEATAARQALEQMFVERGRQLAAHGVRERAQEEWTRQEPELAYWLAEVHAYEGRLRHLRLMIEEKEQTLAEAAPLRSRIALPAQLPVSKPVHNEERFWTCLEGRVNYVPLAELLAELPRAASEKASELRTRWTCQGTLGPVHQWLLHFTLARERSSLDTLFGDLPPVEGRDFRYRLTAWRLEPLAPQRGETLAEALHPGSRFRTQVEALDPERTTLTLIVYPDSFALYRGLRDWLQATGFLVAARPLPHGVPIAGSPQGTVARGQ
ncbi:MAG: hypothetical protein C4297_00385 [Gemmataceae bacterium]